MSEGTKADGQHDRTKRDRQTCLSKWRIPELFMYVLPTFGTLRKVTFQTQVFQVTVEYKSSHA